MNNQPDIVFRNLERSEALEENIADRLAKLDKLFDHITTTRVVIEEAHHHKHQGKLFHVTIHVHVPDKELVVSHDKHDKPEHEDAYIAVRDAFNAMERQVTDYAEKIRGDVKRHSKPDAPEPDEIG